jgi:hypothetical protein
VELYLHSRNTPSWRGAQLKHRNNFIFTFAFTITFNFTFTFLGKLDDELCEWQIKTSGQIVYFLGGGGGGGSSSSSSSSSSSVSCTTKRHVKIY